MFKTKTESFSLWETIVNNKPIAVEQQKQLTVFTRIISVGDSLHIILDLYAGSQKQTDTEKKAWGERC